MEGVVFFGEKPEGWLGDSNYAGGAREPAPPVFAKVTPVLAAQDAPAHGTGNAAAARSLLRGVSTQVTALRAGGAACVVVVGW